MTIIVPVDPATSQVVAELADKIPRERKIE
jgi:hypothetical protein